MSYGRTRYVGWTLRSGWVVLALIAVGRLCAQEGGACSIVRFDVGEDGIPVQRETVSTGGLGRAMSSEQDIEIDARRNLLFAANNTSNDIAVFSIGVDGSLTAVGGSPFPCGGGPRRLALHSGRGVLCVSAGGTVRSYSIGDDGSLVLIQVSASSLPRDIEIHPGGNFLYVAEMGLGVGGYGISGSGTLTELPGSPFSFPSARPCEIEISPDGRMLYVLDLDWGITAFQLGASGALDLIPGSPVAVGGFSHALEVTGDGLHAYVGFPTETAIAGFGLSPGALPASLPGSPFPAQARVVELVAPEGTPLLYEITRDSRSIQAFTISDFGELTALGSLITVTDPRGRVPNAAAFQRLGTTGLSGRLYCLVAPLDVISQSPLFRRGDVNNDKRTNIADAIYILGSLFAQGPSATCLDTADANDDGKINIADAIAILSYLFASTGPLPAPFGDCGVEPTLDDLDCASYPPCAQ
jgi:6-phosphogluconolactonase (cycloisomerase 2 family)